MHSLVNQNDNPVTKISPVQCKMARAALGLGVRDLARLADVSPNTIARFERADPLKESTVATLAHVLEAAGVLFVPENGGGPGVRLKSPASASGDAAQRAQGASDARQLASDAIDRHYEGSSETSETKNQRRRSLTEIPKGVGRGKPKKSRR